MAKDFATIISTTNVLFEKIVGVMKYGLSPESETYKHIDDAIPTLALIDDFVSYNLEHLASDESCTFYIRQSFPWIKEIVARYLIIRFGVLAQSWLNKGQDEQRRPYVQIPESGTIESKIFCKKDPFFEKGKNKTKEHGIILRDVRKYTLDGSLSNDVFRPDDELNLLICGLEEIPGVRSDYFRDCYTTKFSMKNHLSVLSDTDASKIQTTLINTRKSGDVRNIEGNIFVLYSGAHSSRVTSYNANARQRFRKLGYSTKQFVFIFQDDYYRLDKILSIRDKCEVLYKPKDNLFLTNEEELALNVNASTAKQAERWVCKYDGNREIIKDEIRTVLEGIEYPRSYMNIMSLCATPKCKEAFLKYIRETYKDYEDNSEIIYGSISSMWEKQILPKIKSFLGSQDKFSMLIETRTPDEIKNELGKCIGCNINFIEPKALRPENGANSVKDKKIIVMRYVPCTDHPSSYPNSYDPYTLRDNQELLEIIPDILFRGHIQRSEHNISKHYNKTYSSGYKQSIGWKKREVKSTSDDEIYFSMNFDDASTYDDVSANKRVVVEFEDRTSRPLESEPVIYEIDGVWRVDKLRNLIDVEEISGIQFLNELESEISQLAQTREKGDEQEEFELRKKWSVERNVDLSPHHEIWRLLLKNKIDTLGIDAVYESLSPKIDGVNKKQLISNWANLSLSRTLPGRKSSRKAVFEYLNIPLDSAYPKIIYRKYLRQIHSSRKNNSLIDDFLYEVVGREPDQKLYERIKRDIPDSLEYLDINDFNSFIALCDIITKQVNIRKIKSISADNEY